MEQKKARKMKWTKEEDKALMKAVQEYGTDNWKAVAAHVSGRTGKQCRERWVVELDPSLVKNEWTWDEDAQLLFAQSKFGNRWSIIARFLPGRSTTAIKNRWSWFVRHDTSDPSYKHMKNKLNITKSERYTWVLLYFCTLW